MRKRIKSYDIIFILVIIICCLFIYYPNRKRNSNLNKDSKYTIATVIDIKAVSDGDPVAYVSYAVNGLNYQGEVSSCCRSIGGLCEKGDWIFMLFYPDNPNDSKRVGDFYLPDSLIKVPSNGWDSIPVNLNLK